MSSFSKKRCIEVGFAKRNVFGWRENNVAQNRGGRMSRKTGQHDTFAKKELKAL